jgi:hypothetical protein
VDADARAGRRARHWLGLFHLEYARLGVDRGDLGGRDDLTAAKAARADDERGCAPVERLDDHALDLAARAHGEPLRVREPVLEDVAPPWKNE